MAQSPSYSPVHDNIDQPCNSLIRGSDPVLNPFYHAQDRESWYAEVALTAREENRQRESERKRMKKNKHKSMVLKNRSFVMQKVSGPIHRIIKIIIQDVDGREMEDTDPESASVNIQYLVRNDFDEIMSETDYLVSKIVKKLSSK